MNSELNGVTAIATWIDMQKLFIEFTNGEEI